VEVDIGLQAQHCLSARGCALARRAGHEPSLGGKSLTEPQHRYRRSARSFLHLFDCSPARSAFVRATSWANRRVELTMETSDHPRYRSLGRSGRLSEHSGGCVQSSPQPLVIQDHCFRLRTSFWRSS
jgi:hypothetical protein